MIAHVVLSMILFRLEVNVGPGLVIDWRHILTVLLLDHGELLLLEIDQGLVNRVGKLIEGR